MPATFTLGQVLNGVKLRSDLAPEWAARGVAGLAYDSRRVERDFVFFAFSGSRADGRGFAQDAMSRGACAVVSESAAPADFPAPWVVVEHGRQALAGAARNFFRWPDQRVHFTGITGTNGKTTTAYLLDAILREAGRVTGYVTGMIGTIEYRMASERRKAVNTTPESLDIMEFADELARKGGTHLTMEVSSHALALARVWGFHFHTVVFTNLTQDHLDFHTTMEEYAAAKRKLFVPDHAPAPDWSVLNADDPASMEMLPSGGQVLWYGVAPSAGLRAEKIEHGLGGLRFEAVHAGVRQNVESSLAGKVNVSNILAAMGAGLSYGLDLETMARGVSACTAVPGRFERIDCGQPFLVAVDFAHTGDALRNVIQMARELTSGRVITVFGCGGDRDRSKRPLMGMAAAEFSALVVLTSDNPRSEDPLAIMNDVMVGLGRFDTRYITEPDRAKAIRVAFEEAKAGDVVLLAGKGHETHQTLKDKTIDFDDRETARRILRSLGYE